MAYRGYTQAQNKATQKYQKTHLELVSIRVKKGIRDQWKEAAEKSGLPLARFIQEAVEEKIRSLSEENQNEIRMENSSDAPMRLF